jgi:hypothetical protein
MKTHPQMKIAIKDTIVAKLEEIDTTDLEKILLEIFRKY